MGLLKRGRLPRRGGATQEGWGYSDRGGATQEGWTTQIGVGLLKRGGLLR